MANKKTTLTGGRKKSIPQTVGENSPRWGELYALLEAGDE